MICLITDFHWKYVIPEWICDIILCIPQTYQKCICPLGLLHSVPDKDRETVEDLLRECVQETNIGGRKQAVDELREILEKYLNYDDQEEKVSNRNEDDDDNAVVR